MKSILVPVFGGLGNQMFQVAHALNLGQKVGVTPKFTDLTRVTGRVTRRWELDCFSIPQKPLTSYQAVFLKVRISFAVRAQLLGNAIDFGVLDERFSTQRDVVSTTPTVCSGYWQGASFFEEAKDLVKQTFTFPEIGTPQPGLDIDSSRATVAVHVRRGDYVSDPIAHAYHFVCGVDWYLNAIQHMREQVPGAVFYVFSDDQAWAHKQFGAADDVSIVATDPKSPAWIDMALMARCKHFIISNSSYSWWGSYLGKTNNSLTFAPKFWFRDVLTQNQTIYCPDWKLL